MAVGLLMIGKSCLSDLTVCLSRSELCSWPRVALVLESESLSAVVGNHRLGRELTLFSPPSGSKCRA